MREVVVSFRIPIEELSFPDNFESLRDMSNEEAREEIKKEIEDRGAVLGWLGDFFDPDFDVEVVGDVSEKSEEGCCGEEEGS